MSDPAGPPATPHDPFAPARGPGRVPTVTASWHTATSAKLLRDLDRHGRLRRIDAEIDPHLEAAEIHRRVYRAGGPALFFARVKGCRFPMVSNLFGTLERTRFLFRDTLDARAQARRAEGRSRRLRAPALALPRRAARRCGTLLPKLRPQRADPRPPDDAVADCRNSSAGRATAGRSSPCRRSTPRTPTAPAGGSRNLGMYRVQLVRQRLRAGPRGRPALPDPPRHRRPPRRRDPQGRAAPRQRLRRRPAGADARRP